MDILALLKLSWNEWETSLKEFNSEELLYIHETCTREYTIRHGVFINWIEFQSYLRSELRKHGIIFPSFGSAY